MRRSLKKMLRPGDKKEPQNVEYQGVEDDMEDSKDTLKVWGTLELVRWRDRLQNLGGNGLLSLFPSGSQSFLEGRQLGKGGQKM